MSKRRMIDPIKSKKIPLTLKARPYIIRPTMVFPKYPLILLAREKEERLL
jgi:hypothetical protein